MASDAALTATSVTSATRRLATASSSSSLAILSLSCATSRVEDPNSSEGDRAVAMGDLESPPFMRRASWSRRMSAKPSMARRTDGVTLYQSLSPTTRSRMFMKASTEGGRVLPSSRANDISAGLVKTNNRFSGGSSSGGCSRRSRTRSRGYDGQTWLPRDAKDGDTREPCDPSAVR